ncbi:MAG: Fatty acid resistance protein FarB [Chlamydiales bacterium]|nr:Fatty acid resistance protein FarB [Chlamydiales bacterium]MCH9635330.1 Fatty acid resistance protein FarB [Chlamydiales bacterium]
MSGLYIVAVQGGSYIKIYYTLTFFALGNLFTIPLGNRFNHKKLFKICCWPFIFFVILAPLMPTYFLYNLVRFLQGAASGPFFVVIPALMLHFSQRIHRDHYIRNILVCTILATSLGATLSGAMAYGFRWQWMAGLDLMAFVPLTIWFLRNLRSVQDHSKDRPINLFSYLLYIFNTAGVVSFLTVGQQLDWFRSPFYQGLLLILAVTIPLFVLYEQKQQNSLLDYHLLTNKRVLFALFHLLILFAVYFGVNSMLSVWLHVYIEYSADYVCFVLGIMCLAIIFVFFLSSKSAYRESLVALFLGIALIACSSIFSMLFSAEVNFGRIALARTVEGIGHALFLPPLFHIMLDALAVKDVLGGITFFQLTRVLGSGLGPAIFSQIWERRAVFYHSRLGGQFTEFSWLTQETLQKMVPFYLSEDQRHAELQKALTQQVQTLGINDTFFFVAVLMLILLGTIPFFAKYLERHPKVLT